jgi:hypothetical protein
MSCDEIFCNNCWTEEKSHKKHVHEQTNPSDAVIVHTVLRVNLDDCILLKEVIAKLGGREGDHQPGTSNEWFGVSQIEEDLYLSESSAYQDIMLDGLRPSSSNTYPGLVSFLGPTGMF